MTDSERGSSKERARRSSYMNLDFWPRLLAFAYIETS